MRVPEVIGPYRVVRQLGRGAMGMVFEVSHPEVARPMALKLLPELFADDQGKARFEREAQLLARVRHRNVLPVHASGESEAGPWLVMELIEGEDLRASCDGRTLAPREAVRVIAELAEGLGALHAQGILHRDLKPGNVLLRPEGTPIIIDFGLARAGDVQKLTRSGDFLGTPAYMAPEQAMGQPEPRSDVYALGAILYHLLTGRAPFVGKSAIEIFKSLFHEEPPDPAELGVELDPGLWDVVRRSLQKDPAHRQPSAAALRDELRRWLATTREGGKRTRRDPRLLAVGAIVTLLLAGLLFLALRRRDGGTVALDEPPRLELVAAVPSAVIGRRLEVELLARGTGPLELHTPAGSQRVRAGERCGVRLELAKGKQTIELRLTDETGRAAPPLELAVLCHDLPEWFQALPAGKRLAVPLPAGLDCSSREGVYLNAADGSELVRIGGTTIPIQDQALRVYYGRDAWEIRPFLLGRMEVTMGQWRRHCAATGRSPDPDPSTYRDDVTRGAPRPQDLDDRYPAAWISWDEAGRYCEWAGLRLPTALELELAARGDGRRHPWGNSDSAGRANFYERDDDGYPFLAPVGSFESGASPEGCLDLFGNVYEWAADIHPVADAKREDGEVLSAMKKSICNAEASSRVGERTLTVHTSFQKMQIGFRVAWGGR